jgi:ketosteroid isomerase-like protein
VTSDNVRLVRDGVQAFIDGDAAKALEMVHPEMVSTRVAPLPDPQTYRGVDGVLQMYADWTADFADFEMWIGECFEVGDDHVAVELVQRGTGKASGAPVEGRFWFVYEVAGGKTVRQDGYASREQALRAAGVR